MIGNSQTCNACTQAKQYLDAIGEEYEYKDLGTSDLVKRIEWKKQVYNLGIKSIPAIYIDNNPVIIGFNPDKISEYLMNRA